MAIVSIINTMKGCMIRLVDLCLNWLPHDPSLDEAHLVCGARHVVNPIRSTLTCAYVKTDVLITGLITCRRPCKEYILYICILSRYDEHM